MDLRETQRLDAVRRGDDAIVFGEQSRDAIAELRIILGEELLRIQRALDQTVLLITHNIQEAILLSNRVVVLSARPGRMKAVVDIDLPAERDSTLLATDEFAVLVGKVWSVLREESLKAFAQEQKQEQANDEETAHA